MTSELRASTRAPTDSEQRALLAYCDRVAWLLDDCLRIPGTRFRFGLDAIVGLVPLAGDALGFALSAWTMVRAARAGVPRPLLWKMGRNVVIDFFGSLVPVFGDVFDAVFKAHRRNFELLRREYGAALPPAAAAKRASTPLRIAAALLFAAIGYGLWRALGG